MAVTTPAVNRRGRLRGGYSCLVVAAGGWAVLQPRRGARLARGGRRADGQPPHSPPSCPTCRWRGGGRHGAGTRPAAAPPSLAGMLKQMSVGPSIRGGAAAPTRGAARGAVTANRCCIGEEERCIPTSHVRSAPATSAR